MDFPIEEFVNRISYIMKIDGRLSNTFYLLNVISILLIVCMHSVVPVKEVSSQIVVNFVFKGITRIAVPVFFLFRLVFFSEIIRIVYIGIRFKKGSTHL